jgi:hypothetical protein
VALGSLEIAGTLTGARDLGRIATAAVEGHLRLGDYLQGQVRCASINKRSVSVDVQGQVPLNVLVALLPPPAREALARLQVGSVSGSVRWAASLQYDPQWGLRISNVELHGSDWSAAQA